MSISLITEPAKYQPGFNSIQFVVDGANKTACDFHYVCDLYINGTFVIRLKEFPSGANDYGYFNIERIIQDYLSYDFDSRLEGFATNPNGIVSYYCEFRERYGSASPCDGVTTLQSVTYTSSTKYAWNGVLQREVFFGYDNDLYVLTNTSSILLSNIPDPHNIRSDAWFNIDFLQDSNTPISAVEIKTYSSTDTLIGTYRIANPYSAPASTSQLKLSVGVGPENLNAATLSSGSQPVITDSVSYYTIQMYDTASPADPISEVRRFNIDTRCLKFDTKEVWFWNRLGGYDSYVFTSKSTKNIDISRTFFDKLPASNYALKDRGRTTKSVSAQERFTYSTDWLTEDEALWMEQMFTTLEAYLHYKKEVEINISGAVYLGGFLGFVLDNVILADGTSFTYEIDQSSAETLGVDASGSGTIGTYNGIQHTTDIVCPNNVGVLASGTMIAITVEGDLPVIITSPTYEERLKQNIKNIRYVVDLQPAYTLNSQNQ